MFNVWNSKNTEFLTDSRIQVLLTCSLLQGIFIPTISAKNGITHFHFNGAVHFSIFSQELFTWILNFLWPMHVLCITQTYEVNGKARTWNYCTVGGNEKWKSEKRRKMLMNLFTNAIVGPERLNHNNTFHNKNETKNHSQLLPLEIHYFRFFEFLLCCRYFYARNCGFQRGLPVTIIIMEAFQININQEKSSVFLLE